MSILIVEEDGAIMECLVDGLGAKHRLFPCSNTEVAKYILAHNQVEAILLDGNILGASTAPFVKEIKATHSSLRIVVYSAGLMNEHHNAGADVCLDKLCEIKELQAAFA